MQELYLVISVVGNKPIFSQFASKEELECLNISNKNSILDKNNLNLVAACKNCSDSIQVNVFWHSDIKTYDDDQNFEIQICGVKQDLTCEEQEFPFEPNIMIKEEPESDSSEKSAEDDDQKSEKSFVSDPPKPKRRKKAKLKEKPTKEDLPELVDYPGITYPLPAGLVLPPLKDIRAPFFDSVIQKDGSVVFIEKKRQKKWPVRITNYDPRQNRCDICNYKVPSSDRMTAHRRGHMFFKFSDVECRGCGIYCGTKPEDKVNHSFFCPGKDSINGLQCIECGYEANEYKALRAHMKNKHKGYNPAPETNREKQVECPMCKTWLADEYALNTHMKFKCRAADEYNANTRAQMDEYLALLDLPKDAVLPDLFNLKAPHSRLHTQPDGSKIYISKGINHINVMNFDPRCEKCDLCGRGHLKRKADMVEHRLKDHFFPIQADDNCQGCHKHCKTLDEKTSHSHFCAKKNLIRVNFCIKCNLQCASYSKYAKHLKKFHHGEGLDKKFMCHLCSATFDYDRELQLHVIRHMDPKPFKCDHCEADFKGRLGLETHMIRIHFPQEAKQICNACEPPMLFGSIRPYKSHLNMVHFNSKEKAICPICNNPIRKTGLQWHITRQHTQHEFKDKYECNVCGKIFVSKFNLEVHSLVHIPEDQRQHSCQFCDRRFNSKQNCVEHERGHTGEKPYKCETCGKAYARKQTLKDHQREHNGQGYECSVCKRVFTDRGNYRHHMKQHESQMGIKLTFNHEERRLMKLKVITPEQALRGAIQDIN
uniref:CSON000142 protein n=1 Tax=Culicoides sonorensis TaxID=179676 RepID=A0A336LPJ4_CULSO